MKRDVDQLCCGLPDEFCHMLEYSRSLTFHAIPDYDYLRALVQRLRPCSANAEEASPDWLPKIQSGMVHHQLEKMMAMPQNVELHLQ